MFTGRYQEIAQLKQRALDASYDRHPERFVRGRPTVPLPPSKVVINPALPDDNGEIDDRVNFPTLAAAGFEKKSMLS